MKLKPIQIILGFVLLILSSCTEEKKGCTYSSANNYDPTATVDDGSCTFDQNYYVGQSYGGGIIFYIDSTGQHGLISSISDQDTSQPWRPGSIIVTNATGILIGTGASNTHLIITNQGAGTYAANTCDQLDLNGYSDWYLPSVDELKLMSIHRNLIGNFSSTYGYWSSTEVDAFNAHVVQISTGFDQTTYKFNNFRVRAIRSF